MAILQTSDFTGQFQLAQNHLTDMTTYFSRYEKEYLVKLLGADLYTLFDADLTGTPEVPATAPYTTIFNSLYFDDVTPKISHGIKFMLKCFVFYHYVRDNNLYHAITGLVSSGIENATPQIDAKGAQYIVTRFDEGVQTYQTIQRYIELHKDDFPDYNGIPFYRSPVFW